MHNPPLRRRGCNPCTRLLLWLLQVLLLLPLLLLLLLLQDGRRERRRWRGRRLRLTTVEV